jgi:hypothetical protein
LFWCHSEVQQPCVSTYWSCDLYCCHNSEIKP